MVTHRTKKCKEVEGKGYKGRLAVRGSAGKTSQRKTVTLVASVRPEQFAGCGGKMKKRPITECRLETAFTRLLVRKDKTFGVGAVGRSAVMA